MRRVFDGFGVGRSAPVPHPLDSPHVRLWWVTVPGLAVEVYRWGVTIFVGPPQAFLSIQFGVIIT